MSRFLQTNSLRGVNDSGCIQSMRIQGGDKRESNIIPKGE